MFSNQNLQKDGAAITNISVAPITGEKLIQAQQGHFDSSTLLSSFLELDPMRNMVLLQSEWDKRATKNMSFSNSLYKKVVANNQTLNVNGQDGGFKYKMAVETDNCLRTVEDTSYQAADGFIGADGTSFLMTLNKKLAPYQTITIDKAFGMFLMTDDVEAVYTGSGYEMSFKLVGSEQDRNKVYPANFLEADVVYTVSSNSYIAEYSEKLGIPHLPGTTNYIECEFKLGSGQGAEHWFTGKADSYKMQSGYTTADTQKYLQEIQSMYEGSNLALVQATTAAGTTINTAADILEMLTIKSFNERFNSSLMFMEAAKVSTSKGILEFNEGAWQQMRRGKIFTYNRKGGVEIPDLVAVRNYVYLHNATRVEETFLNIEAGSELYDNIERIIQAQANAQVNNLGYLLGTDRILPVNPVSGQLDSLKVAYVKFAEANVPGVGRLKATLDRTLDYLSEDIDVRRKGNNPGGKDHTTYSGYIWDVTDQFYSNNAQLPQGTEAVGGETTARHNMYLVRPERNPIVWGRENGRYSSKKASDISSSNKLMAEGFFIYGFGAMWMPDPSKFVMLELKNKFGGIR
jgi:hypothetical protein|tara:strand:+ start:2669 stop:4387 length:1719 start_codon:yes stop_codon:yes gene_type:complete